MTKLNFVDEKICLEGKKFILVPVLFEFPIALSEVLASPLTNSTKYFFPSLSMNKSSFSESALTTETPTP